MHAGDSSVFRTRARQQAGPCRGQRTERQSQTALDRSNPKLETQSESVVFPRHRKPPVRSVRWRSSMPGGLASASGTLELGRQHGQALVPELRRMLVDLRAEARGLRIAGGQRRTGEASPGCGWEVVCAEGPGAYATGCPIVAVDTHLAIAGKCPSRRFANRSRQRRASAAMCVLQPVRPRARAASGMKPIRSIFLPVADWLVRPTDAEGPGRAGARAVARPACRGSAASGTGALAPPRGGRSSGASGSPRRLQASSPTAGRSKPALTFAAVRPKRNGICANDADFGLDGIRMTEPALQSGNPNPDNAEPRTGDTPALSRAAGTSVG